METKHFLKTLLIFTIMIALGLIGVLLASYFNEKERLNSPSANLVAK